MYAARQRPDWLATSCERYSSLPVVMFEADRFTSTVAPASAAYDEGGIGVHRASQISAAGQAVQQTVGPHRQPHHGDQSQTGRGARDFCQRCDRSVEQRLLVEQVL